MAARRTRSAMLHPQGKPAADAQPGILRKRTAAGAARRQHPFPGAHDAHLAAMVTEDEEGPVDFSGSDDAETLRGTKMKSEMYKRDRKGKSEQVAKYITRLGARIKRLLAREDADMDGPVKRSGLREAAEEHESSSHTVAQPGDSNAASEETEEHASSSAWDDEWTGLLPFIYRAIKARRVRRYSRFRSTGSAPREEDSAWEQNQREADGKVSAAREMTHASLEELAGEAGASPEWRRRRAAALPRGRRGGGAFPCISGGT